MSKPLPIQAIGIVWYRPESYAACMAVMDDAGDLPDTYDEWLDLAERASDSYRKLGRRVVKAFIDPVAFPAWCKTNGHSTDQEGRSHFANVQAYKAIKRVH